MTAKTPLETLTTARALLAKGWTKWQYARDHSGLSISYKSDAAVCFCSSGALARAANLEIITEELDGYFEAMKAIKAEIALESISQWNDAPERTQAEVLEVFDRAITKLDRTPHTNNPTESN